MNRTMLRWANAINQESRVKIITFPIRSLLELREFVLFCVPDRDAFHRNLRRANCGLYGTHVLYCLGQHRCCATAAGYSALNSDDWWELFDAGPIELWFAHLSKSIWDEYITKSCRICTREDLIVSPFLYFYSFTFVKLNLFFVLLSLYTYYI